MNEQRPGDSFTREEITTLYAEMIAAYLNTDDRNRVPSTMKRIVRYLRDTKHLPVTDNIIDHIAKETGIDRDKAKTRCIQALHDLQMLFVLHLSEGPQAKFSFYRQFLMACDLERERIGAITASPEKEMVDVEVRLRTTEQDGDDVYVKINVVINGVEFEQDELRNLTDAAKNAIQVFEQISVPEVVRDTFYKEGKWSFGKFSCNYSKLHEVVAYLEGLPKLLTPVVGTPVAHTVANAFVPTHLSNEFKHAFICGKNKSPFPSHGTPTQLCGYAFGITAPKQTTFEHICAYLSNSGLPIDRPTWGECFENLERVGAVIRVEPTMGFETILILTDGFIDDIAASSN